MNNEKTSLTGNGMIWFGAAVSIAEILTGTLVAPLGFSKGILAILLGHVIGCILLYFAGKIGGTTGKSAMETVKITFGRKGSILFAVLNVLQLVGWTAVMIIGGAKAATVITNPVFGFMGENFWCIVIGGLIILWLLIGVKNLDRINIFAMGGLFLLSIVLSVIVFRGGAIGEAAGGMSFGAAVELSAAMPISWLPLISDYTRFARQPRAATLVSTAVYFVTSCWMFVIGLGAAIFTGESDIAQIMMRAGLGVVGILIIIFSTVTTTFMDAYSAGVSFVSIKEKISEKWVAIIVCVIGTLFAMITPIEQYQDFLYLIGSVFAPMIAIQITDYILIKQDHTKEAVNITNLIIWIVGLLIYRWFLSVDTVVGSTLPAMIITGSLCILVYGGKKICLRK